MLQLSWQKVFRDGFAPEMTMDELLAVREALVINDPLMIQDATVEPELSEFVQPCGACFVSYGLWKANRLSTTMEVSDMFARRCQLADNRLGFHSAIRFFLNWFDETPRQEVFAKLLVEVDAVISERTSTATP